MTRRVFALLGIIGIALLLAFPLRGTVYKAIIIPGCLRVVDIGIGISCCPSIAVVDRRYRPCFDNYCTRSLLPTPKLGVKRTVKIKPPIGQVEALAVWMKKSERGRYFKWLVANRLGKIALSSVSQRETGKARSVFDPLAGSDWKPDEGLQSYLEIGLRGSFADFPHENRAFFKTQTNTARP